MTPTRTLRRLEQLAAAAHDNLYERLQLAHDLLNNTRWIAQQYAGNDAAATDYLQSTYFRELHGFISLPKMLAIFTTFSRQQWEMYNFDLRAMQLVYDQPALLTTPATPADAQAAKRRVAEYSFHVRYADDGELTPVKERQQLQRRLRTIEEERDRIKARLRELGRATA